MSRKCVRIKHAGSNSLIADGPVGWAITPFEGNFYIRKKYLITDGFRINYMPGLCIYKFLYVFYGLLMMFVALLIFIGSYSLQKDSGCFILEYSH